MRRGTYCGVMGPTYETPTEIGAIRTLGGDVVGMSTVPEILAAAHAGVPLLALSLVSNKCRGPDDDFIDPTHEEVLESVASRAKYECECTCHLLGWPSHPFLFLSGTHNASFPPSSSVWMCRALTAPARTPTLLLTLVRALVRALARALAPVLPRAALPPPRTSAPPHMLQASPRCIHTMRLRVVCRSGCSCGTGCSCGPDCKCGACP